MSVYLGEDILRVGFFFSSYLFVLSSVLSRYDQNSSRKTFAPSDLLSDLSCRTDLVVAQ